MSMLTHYRFGRAGRCLACLAVVMTLTLIVGCQSGDRSVVRHYDSFPRQDLLFSSHFNRHAVENVRSAWPSTTIDNGDITEFRTIWLDQQGLSLLGRDFTRRTYRSVTRGRRGN
ncbi:MAG: hypothetical protein ACPGXK_13480 [Phycisphaerae bacterium]